MNPGPSGTPSGHMHEFFGNVSTDSDSTYDSMIAAGITCGLSADTAGCWIPSPHSDFWNTWDQAVLEQVVRDCLQAGVLCDLLQD